MDNLSKEEFVNQFKEYVESFYGSKGCMMELTLNRFDLMRLDDKNSSVHNNLISILEFALFTNLIEKEEFIVLSDELKKTVRNFQKYIFNLEFGREE